MKTSGRRPRSPPKREPELKRVAMEEQSGENSADAKAGVVVAAVEQEKQTVTLTHNMGNESYVCRVTP